jgi:hypothetical protein
MVERATGHGPVVLRRRTKSLPLVTSRQLFCYLARREGFSFPMIGKYLHRDHTTVLYSVRVFRRRLETGDRITNEVFNSIKSESMSCEKKMIEIVPPEYNNVPEESVFWGISCPKCSGSGNTMEWGIKENYKMACERCGGSGRLRALVRIAWEPDKRIED